MFLRSAFYAILDYGTFLLYSVLNYRQASFIMNQKEEPWAWIRKLRDTVNAAESNCEQVLPAEILPWLYISDEASALDTEKLQSLGITHVLSVNGAPRHRDRYIRDLYATHGITHKRVHGEDSEGYNMIEKHWEDCHAFLKQVQNDGSCKVVVHCVAGINRSGLITCAAHMIMEEASVLDVVKHCIDKRGPVLWNKSFQKQLCLLAARNNLLGDKPEDTSDDPMEPERVPPPPRKAFDRLFH